MMNNEVFVIMCESGHWDSYHTWIGGIFDDSKKAKEECDKLNARAKQIQDSCPIKKREEDMSDEEEVIFNSWWVNNQTYAEWGPAKVVEYTLNEIVKQ